eukprot:scaffold249345_cov64-Cyclotella_meneghiniana.AAC.3
MQQCHELVDDRHLCRSPLAPCKNFMPLDLLCGGINGISGAPILILELTIIQPLRAILIDF